MGICGPPPKAKIRHTFRKPNGKTLNANRRNKLLHLLKAERNKGKTFGGKLPHTSAVDNRPSTSAGIATMVPPLMISSSVASSANGKRQGGNTPGDTYGSSHKYTTTSQKPKSEWTELMEQDAARFKEENEYVRKLRKHKQKEFAKSLEEQVKRKKKKKPLEEGHRTYRKRIEDEKRIAYKAKKQAEKNARKNYEKFKQIQDENIRIRRERIAREEEEDRAIEAKMLQDAKEGYRKQHEAIRMKMKARKQFLADAMKESHGYKKSLHAAEEAKEKREEALRKRHNAIVERAFHTGKNHRQVEADRIRAVQDRLYNLGKTWMPKDKEIVGGVNDNAVSIRDIQAYEAVLKAQKEAELLMKKKKKQAILDQRKFLEMQIKQKEDARARKKREEREFARKCKESKYLNDQIIMLQQQRKSQLREKYAKELRNQLASNEVFRRENDFQSQDRPMTQVERQMNSQLLKSLGKSKCSTGLKMSNRSGGSISQPLLSIRSYNALTKKKVVSDSVIPPWQTDHTPTGELAMHEYRKNLINPHEDVLNGTYQLPMPNEKTGHWGDKTQSRPGTTAGYSGRSSNFSSARYSYTNDAYKQLRSSFHPRKKSNWFDD